MVVMVMVVVVMLGRGRVGVGGSDGGGRLRGRGGGRGGHLGCDGPPSQPGRDRLGGDRDGQVLRRRGRGGPCAGARVSAVRLHVRLEGRLGRGELPHPQAGPGGGGPGGGDGIEVESHS